MTIECVMLPLADTEGLSVELPNAWGGRPQMQRVGFVRIPRPKRRPLVVVDSVTRRILRTPPDFLCVEGEGWQSTTGRVVVAPPMFRELARRCGEKRRELWAARIVEGLPKGAAVTAEALRARGIVEGWLREAPTPQPATPVQSDR